MQCDEKPRRPAYALTRTQIDLATIDRSPATTMPQPRDNRYQNGLRWPRARGEHEKRAGSAAPCSSGGILRLPECRVGYAEHREAASASASASAQGASGFHKVECGGHAAETARPRSRGPCERLGRTAKLPRAVQNLPRSKEFLLVDFYERASRFTKVR